MTAEEGALLFQQSAPQRLGDIDAAQAAELSRLVAGHPLSLRLLAGAFNQSSVLLSTFLKDCETHLLEAENKYVEIDHRHRSLYACLETSVRSLDADLAALFSKLWLFRAPFLPSTAVALCDPEHDDGAQTPSPVEDQLYALWQRGLLSRATQPMREGTLVWYRVLPTIRPYIEHYLAHHEEQAALYRRFAAACATLVDFLHQQLDRGSIAAFLALLCRDDLEYAASFQEGETRGRYLLNWGWVLQRLGYRKRGLALTEQALEIAQGQDHHLMLQAWNNMAGVYSTTGQPTRALELYEQALPLTREVGDRAGEATTLNGLAYLFLDMQRYSDALTTFEHSIAIEQQVHHPAGEVAGLVGLALLLYQHLERRVDALLRLEQALMVMEQIGLSHDAAGRTLEQIRALLDAIRQGDVSTSTTNAVQTMPSEQIQPIIANTITVMTAMPNRHEEWRQTIAHALHNAEQQGATWQIEVDFFSALLQVLDGQTPLLPDDHPYRSALNELQAGLLAGAPQEKKEESRQKDEPLPFDAELVPRSIAAMLGSPQEKLSHAQYLSAMSMHATSEELKALIQAIHVALFGGDRSGLGQDLVEVYRQAWEAILLGVETEGIDPEVFETLVRNTLAVLGPVPGKRGEWRTTLSHLKEQTLTGRADQLGMLVDIIIQLLDADGKPAGLGVGLRGVYARSWQEILTHLPS